MKKLKKLNEILNHIKTIRKINVFNIRTDIVPDCLLCLIGNAIRGGILTNTSAHQDLASSIGFSEYFGVSFEDAGDLLFLRDPFKRDHNGDSTGNQYYKAGQALIKKYSKSTIPV